MNEQTSIRRLDELARVIGRGRADFFAAVVPHREADEAYRAVLRELAAERQDRAPARAPDVAAAVLASHRLHKDVSADALVDVVVAVRMARSRIAWCDREIAAQQLEARRISDLLNPEPATLERNTR